MACEKKYRKDGFLVLDNMKKDESVTKKSSRFFEKGVQWNNT